VPNHVCAKFKLAYPYKLSRGIANQIVTFDILKEEGFDDIFLKKAKKLLQNYI